MNGRTWKEIRDIDSSVIKEYLLRNGGYEVQVGSQHEAWSIQFSDSKFTFYKKGTLFSTSSRQYDPAVFESWKYIDGIIGGTFIQPKKNYLIGFDETGKGELVGHIHLAGVLFPKNLFQYIEETVGVADTKKRHPFEYWDTLYKKLTNLLSSGLIIFSETIPPWDIDKYNINKIMDVAYQRILNKFAHEVDIDKCRIVVDDYGIGPALNRTLIALENMGAEVIVAQASDDKYLEARVASLISKRGRESVLKAINNKVDFRVNGLSIGTGNAGNHQTLDWLNAWHDTGKQWPWFIRKSYSTIRKIDGLDTAVKKQVPPIREELVSNEFLKGFEDGNLDVRALSVVCPKCGSTSRSIKLAHGGRRFEARCPSCNGIINFIDTTLRYYCGYVVPDSNIVTGGLLGKDLDSGRFFQGFTICIPSVVRYECDTPGGKKEFERLGKFKSVGRIHLKAGKQPDENTLKGLSTRERDDLFIQECLKENAILLTKDKQLQGLALAKNIFTICF